MRLPIALAAIFTLPFAVQAEDWREFRGPTGQGHYDGKGLPIEWSSTKNVAWKTKIPGHGWSSPIVLAGRVYLTSAVSIPESKNLSLKAICLDARNGAILWQTQAFQQNGAKAPRIHNKNSHASPTPITDGKRLYVHFGHQGTACLDLDGKLLWTNKEHRYAPVHGNGGTPILVGDRLIFSGDGSDKQFIVALDTATGKTLWKTDRKSDASRTFSFSTPLLIDSNGRKQIISPASDMVSSYDPETGKENWRVKYDGYSVIPRPVFGQGMIFICTGYNTPSAMAIRVDDADGATKRVAWSTAKGAPHTPSLLLVGTELYMVSDRGIASCLEARTGKLHWQERVGGAFSASPFHADGKVYLQSEEGVTTVLKAGKTFEVLAKNELKERTFASYAVADGAIYLRTETQLYCLRAK